ncbi:hypothetical protein GLOIN_2v1600807 [Rhizophagus irregularis DAOM 181602=DAOM 197198]|nr:hypothetical protein GLOIN_2v1600807 [Rhizophagus irregularis DAOM 181602=DAOM 197198]
MFFRVLGVTSLVAVVATNTSRVVHPQDRYHTKKEEQQTSNYNHNHYNVHPHYQFQYQLKPKYPAFTRYSQGHLIKSSPEELAEFKSSTLVNARKLDLVYLINGLTRLTRNYNKIFFR